MRKYITLAFVLLTIVSCKPPKQYHKLSGQTMGTYYAVTFQGHKPGKVKKEIDQLLIDFNNSLSTYIPSSLISQLNASEEGIDLPSTDPYFEPVLDRAQELYEMTGGRLNTAIMPLIKYWRDNKSKIDTAEILRVKGIVDSSKFEIIESYDKRSVFKSTPEAKLDFSSLAKGYGIDIIAAYFDKKGITDYLVDIGGEARAMGKNDIGQSWTLAINKPREGSGLREVEVALQLDGKSIATSGTYRQFYQKDGKKIAHIIDPISGLSIESDLLSASVIADDCMTADGIATALMIYNLEGAKQFLRNHDYPALLIYDADGDEVLDRYYANGFEEVVLGR